MSGYKASIGHYLLLESLGHGGMGQVFLGLDPLVSNRRVAVKIMRTDRMRSDGDSVTDPIKRFEREAAMMSELSHPNIVSLLDYGVDDGTPFLVMEYVDGVSLSTWVTREDPPLPRLCHVFSRLAAAVDFAHARNILHRDLKPANVLIGRESHVVKLADFGIAKLLSVQSLTGDDLFIGSAHYMSPEQLVEGVIDCRSDIWALACTAYYIIGGRKPFESEPGARNELFDLITYDEPLPPTRLAHHAIHPGRWANVFTRALAKDPHKRFQTAAALAGALERELTAQLGVPHTVLPPDELPDLQPASPSLPDPAPPQSPETIPKGATAPEPRPTWRFKRLRRLAWIGAATALIATATAATSVYYARHAADALGSALPAPYLARAQSRTPSPGLSLNSTHTGVATPAEIEIPNAVIDVRSEYPYDLSLSSHGHVRFQGRAPTRISVAQGTYTLSYRTETLERSCILELRAKQVLPVLLPAPELLR